MSETRPKWDYIDYLKIVPAIILGIIIFYFSSLSNPYSTPLPGQMTSLLNPLMHVVEFGLFSFLIFFGLFSKVNSIYLLTISFFYAIFDEIHQYFVPYRYFDVIDLIIDSVGVVLGFLVYLLAKKLYLNFKGKRDGTIK
ncbi:MAG: VanZ family protein [Promethearchaeota archaeon]|jgi:VanZ family protein